jgi:protein-L-isoaspartate(D-aspartate) O-methyltransferase
MFGVGRRHDSAVAARERFEKERERMVEEQLVRRGIVDPGVLEAMRKVPRHLFVGEALWDQAYGDHPLPIGEGQTISQPYMVGLMTQLLRLTGSEKVLEIGTGSGYQTAVLAELSRQVWSVERLPSLAERARRVLDEEGYTTVWIRVANGTYGWQEEAPFDRILVTAGSPSVPPPLLGQLAEPGRMVLPIGGTDVQTLTVVERLDGETRSSTETGCVFVKLIGEHAWTE